MIVDYRQVWIVPMRNWNHCGISRASAHLHVWIVPMRNWNWKGCSLSRTRRSDSLDRTYEELKQSWDFRAIAEELESLDRTYEELKLWNKTLFIPSENSLDRTYEELKLHLPFMTGTRMPCVWIVPMRNWNSNSNQFHPSNSVVWIVPMRNWNTFIAPAGLGMSLSLDRTYEELKPISSASSADDALTVWIVPMRNWNLRNTNTIRRRRRKFGSYLWGIETCFWLSSIWSSISSLDRTYEELKQPFYQLFFAGEHEFGSYLWGIETRLADEAVRAGEAFGSYLWGIETCHGSLGRRFRDVWFGSYLWGIETDLRMLSSLPSNVWIVPMRNWNIEILAHVYKQTWTGLDRTYEELKLRRSYDRLPRPKQFGSYLWGIETRLPHRHRWRGDPSLDRTYEELKHVRAEMPFGFGVGLDRTYEELKPCTGIMYYVVIHKFGSYLWGIVMLD